MVVRGLLAVLPNTELVAEPGRVREVVRMNADQIAVERQRSIAERPRGIVDDVDHDPAYHVAARPQQRRGASESKSDS